MSLVAAVTVVLLHVMPVRVTPIHVPEAEGGPMRGWVASVDLDHPLIQVRVVRGGADPDGDGMWQTRLMNVARIAEREDALLAVNGDFFSAAPQTVLGRQIKYAPGAPARVIGWAMTDGDLWGVRPAAKPPRPTLWIGPDGRADIRPSLGPPPWATQGVSGSTMLIEHGNIVAPATEDRHPRTAAGLTDNGRLILIVIDGRREGWSQGATLRELAQLLAAQNTTTAVNLDGGGSTTMWYGDAVLNRPINNGFDLNRPVANAVIVSN